MILYHDLVEFPLPSCHLEALVGITAPVNERKVLNDPKGLLGADANHIPVLLILEVIARTVFFVLWAMQHRWD